MKYSLLNLIFALGLSIFLFSCEKDNSDNSINPLDGFTKFKEGYAIGAKAKIEIWGKKKFFVGYNNLFVVVYDSLNLNQKITDAHIDFMPVMSMGTGSMAMQHAAPVENPSTSAVNGVFAGAIAFLMPTTTSGTWKLSVGVHNHKYDKEGEADFDITVDNPSPSVLSVFTSTESSNPKLVLSILQPNAPKVGMNDIEFTIHQKLSMMEWPANDSYTIEITPEMPSMQHGSPNNVNPVNVGNGHYKGKVNFTMTGEWKINVIVKKDGIAVSQNLYFMITL